MTLEQIEKAIAREYRMHQPTILRQVFIARQGWITVNIPYRDALPVLHTRWMNGTPIESAQIELVDLESGIRRYPDFRLTKTELGS